MSNTSLQLSMPYIQGGQAQKHVTHNEAIRTLDTLVQLSVLAQATEPTGTIVEGDRFIVAPGATGDFAGHEGSIAAMENGVWAFFPAKMGWVAYDASTGGQIVYNGNDWTPTVGGANVTSTDRIGVNATADTTNRLAVAAEATLLTHDSGGSHQVKINKSLAGDTASLLFQTGYSGRAEMGTAGSDDFAIKVSADGGTFYTALTVDSASGAVSLPNTALADPQFGAPDLITKDYVCARSSGLVANFSGLLGNGYNYPAALQYDAMQTPNLPAAFSRAGYYMGLEELEEFIAVDPNRMYKVGVYIRQEGTPGDWSSFENADRHTQYVGFRCYDADGLEINAGHHCRYRHNDVDSLTTLTQPLAPGDTAVHVADASGWNETHTSSYERGLVIFGYRDSHGRSYDHYSRIEDIDLFDLGGVDKATGEITLNQALPAALGNPDDPGGVWPVGTRLANRGSSWNYKFSLFERLIVDATDTWYRVENMMGGIDQSGRNVPTNFAPGTAMVRPMMLLNYSNRSGGWNVFPDTGAAQRTWVTGFSMDAENTGTIERAVDGSCDLYVVKGDIAGGTVSFDQSSVSVSVI